MFMRTLVTLGSAAALTLIPVAGAQADGQTALDKGGAHCLRFGYGGLGATQSVLSLDIDPADHPTKQRMWWVSGVERATNPDVLVDNYVNQLSGTATLAKPNNNVPGKKIIHMSLSGTSYGSDFDVNVTGMWQINYNLQLNRKTLKGKIVGLATFTPIAADGTAGTPTTYATNSAVKPFSCKKL